MRIDLTSIPERVEYRVGGTRLLARLHRDISLAAVARALGLAGREFDAELEDAIERGAAYVSPEPVETLSS